MREGIARVPQVLQIAPGRLLLAGRQCIHQLVKVLTGRVAHAWKRDLEDVRALLDAGGDLVRALADAPRKDPGFSPVTFAWVLEQLPIAAMGRAMARPQNG
jgi:hypothetical protein